MLTPIYFNRTEFERAVRIIGLSKEVVFRKAVFALLCLINLNSRGFKGQADFKKWAIRWLDNIERDPRVASDIHLKFVGLAVREKSPIYDAVTDAIEAAVNAHAFVRYDNFEAGVRANHQADKAIQTIGLLEKDLDYAALAEQALVTK